MTTELWQRIGFTVGALLVYRLGTYVPLSGLDHSALDAQILASTTALFGNAASRFSIFALSLVPYLSAAFLIQIAVLASQRLRRIVERGDRGRVKIEIITLLLTAVLALFQSYGIASALQGVPHLVATAEPIFLATTLLSLSGGALFLAWLASQITDRGIGNGVAMILCAGIVAEAPQFAAAVLQSASQGILPAGGLLFVVLFSVALTALVVTVELARRNFVVERLAGQGRAQLSIKLNPAGIMSHALALWLMLIPLGLSWLSGLADAKLPDAIARELSPGGLFYTGSLTLFIAVASLVYTAFLWDPQRMAERLQTFGLTLQGVAPGEATAAELDHTLSRLAVVGGIYLALVALGPELLFVRVFNWPFVFGGFALFVVVATVLDVKTQFAASLHPNGGESRSG